MSDKNIHVLLIEDDEDDYILTRELLSDIPTGAFELEWIYRFDEGVEALRRNAHDICLLDYRLGAKTGLDMLRLLGEEIDRIPPVIMLTGMGSLELDMETMRLGASDYLAKSSLTEQSLERAIRYSLQRRAAFEDLQASRNLNLSILSSMSTLIVVLNHAGIVLSSNLDAGQFRNYPHCPLQQTAVGQDYLSSCRQEAVRGNKVIQDFLVGLQRVMRGEAHEYSLEYACGSEVRESWFFANVTPLIDGNGGVVISFSDVSSRVWAAEEIRRLNEELEERVQQRTKELAGANQRLTILDRLKSKFVADVSHELRTPITNLKLYINLMKRGVPDKRNHYISVIDEQIERLTDLVEDTLVLSRLETGDDPLRTTQVDLFPLLNGIVASFQEKAQTKELSLGIETLHTPLFINADVDKVNLLVQHLLHNAINYTETGMIRLQGLNMTEGAFIQSTPEGSYTQPEISDDAVHQLYRTGVCLVVSDTGTGIDKESLVHVFDRFYRSYGNRQADIPGTGLGLSIVWSIVHLHGGHVQLQSVVGQGTTVRIWLPKQTTPVPEPV
jgi:signal transduction histidine kinase/ActR/RegA family two-component response regulator